jgi:hypothetical protein
MAPMLAATLRDHGGNYANGFAARMGLAIFRTIAVSLLPTQAYLGALNYFDNFNWYATC